MDGHGGCTGGGWTTTTERDRYADVDRLPGGYLDRSRQRVAGEGHGVSLDDLTANCIPRWHITCNGLRAVRQEGLNGKDCSAAEGENRSLKRCGARVGCIQLG